MKLVYEINHSIDIESHDGDRQIIDQSFINYAHILMVISLKMLVRANKMNGLFLKQTRKQELPNLIHTTLNPELTHQLVQLN